MLDDIDDVDLRLALIEAAQQVYDHQSSPEHAEITASVRGAAYDAAIAMRDGVSRIDGDIIGLLRAVVGEGAVLTWYLACSELVGPLRPEILGILYNCDDQFAWPVQFPEARESLASVADRQQWREDVDHALGHAARWHAAWSEGGPVGAIADYMSHNGVSGLLIADCANALGLGLHFLASWRLRVIEL